MHLIPANFRKRVHCPGRDHRLFHAIVRLGFHLRASREGTLRSGATSASGIREVESALWETIFVVRIAQHVSRLRDSPVDHEMGLEPMIIAHSDFQPTHTPHRRDGSEKSGRTRKTKETAVPLSLQSFSRSHHRSILSARFPAPACRAKYAFETPCCSKQ